MSQRGRGSQTGGDDPEDLDAADHPDDHALLPPATGRPIEPYDPYRPRGENLPRLSGRGSSDLFAPPPRRPVRPGGSDPFLPDDDPLNSEAWDIEYDAVDLIEDDGEDAPEPPPAPARARRATPASRKEPTRAAASQPGRRARSRPEPSRPAIARPAVTIGMPRVVTTSPLASDSTALILLGIGLVSVLVMALLLAVRLGGLPDTIVLHLNAAGMPDRWGAPSVLWRLPIMSLFMTVMFSVVAWFLYPIDRFGARFALAAAVVAQLVAWVAVIQHLA
ncbi:MAG: DUF1648 domain-containing protein [Thermomicrobiales bacterium]